MDKELLAKLNSLEKRLEAIEKKQPGPLMYKRPGGEIHENLVNFLNDSYIELQEVRQCLENLSVRKQQ
jgi:hypothetical protein